MTGKTLAELDVKPGDVVRYDGSYGDTPTAYIIAGWHGDGCYHTRQEMGSSPRMNSAACWSIISRATPDAPVMTPNPSLTAAVAQLDAKDDTPKLWRDMTDAEKGALLLAHHEGKVIQYYTEVSGLWCPTEPLWASEGAYRIKPEPTRETVTLYMGLYYDGDDWLASETGGDNDTHVITFDIIDGKPDASSIKMNEME